VLIEKYASITLHIFYFFSLCSLTSAYYERHSDAKADDPLTYISVHVRRSDYAMYLNYWYKKGYVEDDYFVRAVTFFRQKFEVSPKKVARTGK
jgi:hypothetical protein